MAFLIEALLLSGYSCSKFYHVYATSSHTVGDRPRWTPMPIPQLCNYVRPGGKPQASPPGKLFRSAVASSPPSLIALAEFHTIPDDTDSEDIGHYRCIPQRHSPAQESDLEEAEQENGLIDEQDP
ncbi:hypothetical protein BDD12DRAFT_886509 [Trichophaea hybrida]|nr:hypothetical protein BDD12DRAFT_886509 [Trichophaea hybrida]